MVTLQMATKENIDREIIQSNMPSVDKVQRLSEYFATFSDCTRLRILILLSIRSMQVGDIASMLSINQTTVSHQLKTLRTGNLVDYYREGKNVVYFLKNSAFIEMMDRVVDDVVCN